jgi:phage terminase small subunit
VELTDKQKAFIEEYLVDFNATRAAQRAGYKGDDNTLASVGSENLRKPKIAEAIAKRFQERVMTADEVLARLSEMSRGDLSDFVKDHGAIDWDAVQEKGYLVKRISHTKGKQSSIELYDAQSALVQIGKHYRLWIERHEHTGEDGGPILIQVDK